MCTGGEILALSAAVGGAYLQKESADDAAAQQNKILRQAGEENSRLQAKKADTITDFAESTFDPSSRDQKYESAATKNESTLKDALLSAQGGEGQVYTGTEGNLSSDYSRGKAEATAKATQDILNRTKLLGRSNAGSLLYNDESIKGSQLASDLFGINASGQRTSNATGAALTGAQDRGSTLGGLLMGGAGAAGSAYDRKFGNSGVIWN